MGKLFTDPKPQEKDYKDFTDYAEAALAWHDLEAERLNEKIDFMEGGYESRHRRVTEMLNNKETPTAWQLKNCSLYYLVDTLLDQLNKNRALRELLENGKKDDSWARLRAKVQHMREEGDSDLRTILFYIDNTKALYDE